VPKGTNKYDFPACLISPLTSANFTNALDLLYTNFVFMAVKTLFPFKRYPKQLFSLDSHTAPSFNFASEHQFVKNSDYVDFLPLLSHGPVLTDNNSSDVQLQRAKIYTIHVDIQTAYFLHNKFVFKKWRNTFTKFLQQFLTFMFALEDVMDKRDENFRFFDAVMEQFNELSVSENFSSDPNDVRDHCAKLTLLDGFVMEGKSAWMQDNMITKALKREATIDIYVAENSEVWRVPIVFKNSEIKTCLLKHDKFLIMFNYVNLVSGLFTSSGKASVTIDMSPFSSAIFNQSNLAVEFSLATMKILGYNSFIFKMFHQSNYLQLDRFKETRAYEQALYGTIANLDQEAKDYYERFFKLLAVYNIKLL
jgi:hypothetical protein